MTDDSSGAQVIGRVHRVVRPLLAAGVELDVISHSWGTVVAYEGFRELADAGLTTPRSPQLLHRRRGPVDRPGEARLRPRQPGRPQAGHGPPLGQPRRPRRPRRRPAEGPALRRWTRTSPTSPNLGAAASSASSTRLRHGSYFRSGTSPSIATSSPRSSVSARDPRIAARARPSRGRWRDLATPRPSAEVTLMVASPNRPEPAPTPRRRRRSTPRRARVRRRRRRIAASGSSRSTRCWQPSSTPCGSTSHAPGRRGRTDLQPGPVGEYLEVVDYDPASGCFYAPVDLNHPHLLARTAWRRRRANPQFHQQMVYAVAMTTIRHFEQALGPRGALVAAARPDGRTAGTTRRVRPRLRIYPHALREANAYYSPEKKALLFGYFPASAGDAGPQPARRDGLHLPVARHHRARDDARPARRHAPALHRAEQPRRARLPRGVRRHRRAVPALLLSRGARHQIAETRGDLASQNLLGAAGPAVRPGDRQARRAAQRPRRSDPKTGDWKPRTPDPAAYRDRAASRTPAGRSWWRPCSTRSWPSTSAADRRPAAHRHRRHAASCRRATCTPTWSTAWPARRPSRPATS